jgi:hypothetical protein
MKTIYYKFFLLSAIIFCWQIRSVIIVVHGTFASNESWYRADGDFVKSVKESMFFLPDGDIGKKSAVISFRWSGNNSFKSRLEAAKDLVELILSYPLCEPIILILHSHAGNVGALATTLLKNPLCLVSKNFDEQQDFFELQIERCLRLLKDQQCDNFLLKEIITGCSELVVQASLRDPIIVRDVFSLVEERSVSRVYLLATPVDVSLYACDMSIVKECYSLYSTEDFIQTVAGFYGRVFPKSKCLINIDVKKRVLSKKKIGLGHSGMRGCDIGFWLLLLPGLIQKELKLKPENFDEHEKINLLLFSCRTPPLLKIGSWKLMNKSMVDEYVSLRRPLKKEDVPEVQFGYANYSANMSL